MKHQTRILRALLKTMGKTKWRINDIGHLRSVPDGLCPIAFTARVATGLQLGNGGVTQSGRLIGMKPKLSAELAILADGHTMFDKRRLQLRRLLWKAAGLFR